MIEASAEMFFQPWFPLGVGSRGLALWPASAAIRFQTSPSSNEADRRIFFFPAMSPSPPDATTCSSVVAGGPSEGPRAMHTGVAALEVLAHPSVTEDRGDLPRPTLPAELVEREAVEVPLSILLVEDNPGDIRLVREVFERATPPVQLTIARDGQEALALLQKASRMPELILLDLNLPGTDGRAVLRRLKSDPLMMRTPVAVLTNSSAPQDVLSAYDRHANCYLVKPTDFETYERVLLRLVSFWLEVARLPSR